MTARMVKPSIADRLNSLEESVKDLNRAATDRQPCAHCWHLRDSYTNTAGGSDMYVCCHCGVRTERTFRFATPPGHGNFYPGPKVKVKTYTS